MRRADLADLSRRLDDLVRRSPLGGHLRQVVLDPDDASEESGFIRVLVELDALDGMSETEMEALTAAIEDLVGGVDERFPSVRFVEPA